MKIGGPSPPEGHRVVSFNIFDPRSDSELKELLFSVTNRKFLNTKRKFYQQFGIVEGRQDGFTLIGKADIEVERYSWNYSKNCSKGKEIVPENDVAGKTKGWGKDEKISVESLKEKIDDVVNLLRELRLTLD